jgi:hypothetical protein
VNACDTNGICLWSEFPVNNFAKPLPWTGCDGLEKSNPRRLAPVFDLQQRLCDYSKRHIFSVETHE